MNIRSSLSFAIALFACIAARAGLDFDAGADLRVRHELMDNVPGLPGGGLLSRAEHGKFTNQMRFRPRVWGEMRGETEDWGAWRLNLRLCDEFRWNPEPHKHSNTFPDEVVIDNLFIEGTGLFDGFLDLSVGRQDLYNLYGLNHIFYDGTPGDGSRSSFADMVRATFHSDGDAKLDLFFLHDADDNELRWGTERSKHRQESGICPGADPEMDDWGWGAVWSDKVGRQLDWQLFALQKVAEEYRDPHGVKHPWTRRETGGFKVVPHLTDEFSLQFEGMGQIGRNDDDDWLSGWSAYAAANWKSSRARWKPFASLGFHAMSGDEDAADEDGGNHAWDPLWFRGVNDYSEIFLYGTHYGVGWMSNMMYLRPSAGIDFGRRHRLELSSGPIFADAKDGLGGGDGAFKGELNLVRYDFPIWLADASKGERFEVYGHVWFETFVPGDYYDTDRPSWFFRWQVDFRF